MAGNDDMLIDYMLESGAHNTAEQQIARNQARIKALQGMNDPDYVSGGRIKRSNPLGAVASIANSVAGAYGQNQIDQQSRDLGAARTKGIADLRARMQRPTEAARYSTIPLGEDSGDSLY